jgi:hypothetical protein
MSKMLTIAEAAQHYHVSAPTIRRWIRSGRVRSQLTLGPFGEQWMVEPDSLGPEKGLSEAYVALDQGGEQGLIKEAEEALQEAWKAKEEAERELAALKKSAPAPSGVASDLAALRLDLEGSERARQALLHELAQARQEAEQAWRETRTALRALESAYAAQTELQAEVNKLNGESLCLRQALARRLGLDWEEHSLTALFLRWEAYTWDDGFPTTKMDGGDKPRWSSFRRFVSAEGQAVTG